MDRALPRLPEVEHGFRAKVKASGRLSAPVPRPPGPNLVARDTPCPPAPGAPSLPTAVQFFQPSPNSHPDCLMTAEFHHYGIVSACLSQGPGIAPRVFTRPCDSAIHILLVESSAALISRLPCYRRCIEIGPAFGRPAPSRSPIGSSTLPRWPPSRPRRRCLAAVRAGDPRRRPAASMESP